MIEAVTGAAGIDVAAAERPDMIVLDLGLPDMEGVEVSRRIRAWSQTPILVLSASLLVIDLVARSVTVRGVPVHLTPVEWELLRLPLRCLMRQGAHCP